MASRVMVPVDAKPKLDQAEFDEAVKTNIDDFGMEAAEAVQSAVEEFKMQGYDLSCVIKKSTGGDTSSHPIAVATKALEAWGAGTGDDTSQLAPLLEQLQLEGLSKDDLQEAHTVALRAETVPALLACCSQLAAAGPAAAGQLADALRALGRLIAAESLRGAFGAAEGAPRVQAVLRAQLAGSQVDWALGGATAALAEAACLKDEENKCTFVDIGFVGDLCELLQRPGLTMPAAGAAAGALRAFTTADDERPPSSKAFAHARMFAKNHQALTVLLGVLRQLGPDDGEATLQLLAAVRQLAANDDICKDFCDAGGVAECLKLLRSGAGVAEQERAAAGALRQLANSDSVKSSLAATGALADIMRLLQMRAGMFDVCEPALGLLTAMTLRMPDIAGQAVEAGAGDALMEVLAACTQAGSAKSSGAGPAGRQACMALRNIVVRCPELRAGFLAKGAEGALRAVKAAHPAACKDAASAALRDLGLDNYNE